jgi:hypothetical protein
VNSLLLTIELENFILLANIGLFDSFPNRFDFIQLMICLMIMSMSMMRKAIKIAVIKYKNAVLLNLRLCYFVDYFEKNDIELIL